MNSEEILRYAQDDSVPIPSSPNQNRDSQCSTFTGRIPTMTWLGEILNPLGLSWLEALAAVLLLGAVTVGGTLLTGLWLVKIPADFFCAHRARDFGTRRHPVVRWGGRVLQNLLGGSLIVLGIILALPGVPGPGVLTMLFGVTLLDFPGKRRLERWLIGRPAVFSAVNRLRQRYGKPPVVLGPRPAKCEP